MRKTAVVAIGGNSLITDEKHQSVGDQLQAVRKTCTHIASMVERGWEVVVTHGNGPQVGFILLRSEMSSKAVHTVPLDSCGAETQGELGYMIQQCLQNEFLSRQIRNPVATIVTQVLVKKNDPAFRKPTKPIGPFYSKRKAEKHRKERKWKLVEDAGRGWRRVVPSPMPICIVELAAIKTLVNQGVVVIAAGGGGIPVVERRGKLNGVEAVIDKDYASAILAIGVHADLFLISTSVEKVALNYGKQNQKLLDKITVLDAKKYFKQGHFPPGSMGPKIRAVISFLEHGEKKLLSQTLRTWKMHYRERRALT